MLTAPNKPRLRQEELAAALFGLLATFGKRSSLIKAGASWQVVVVAQLVSCQHDMQISLLLGVPLVAACLHQSKLGP